jgi:hypothetical protein
MFAFGGVLFPTDLLPAYLRWPSYLNCLQFITNMLSGLGARGPVHLWSVLWILLLTLGYVVMGVLALRHTIERAKAKATLDFT